MFQEITIVGNLGRDPEMRYTQDGTAVTNLSVATNRRWNDPNTGEQQEETTWFRCSVWGRQAETVNQYLEKGRQILVKGRLRPDPSTGGPRLFTRHDGTVGASFEVRAFNVTFLGGGNGAGQNGQSANRPDQEPAEEDDIPF